MSSREVGLDFSDDERVCGEGVDIGEREVCSAMKRDLDCIPWRLPRKWSIVEASSRFLLARVCSSLLRLGDRVRLFAAALGLLRSIRSVIIGRRVVGGRVGGVVLLVFCRHCRDSGGRGVRAQSGLNTLCEVEDGEA